MATTTMNTFEQNFPHQEKPNITSRSGSEKNDTGETVRRKGARKNPIGIGRQRDERATAERLRGKGSRGRRKQARGGQQVLQATVQALQEQMGINDGLAEARGEDSGPELVEDLLGNMVEAGAVTQIPKFPKYWEEYAKPLFFPTIQYHPVLKDPCPYWALRRTINPFLGGEDVNWVAPHYSSDQLIRLVNPYFVNRIVPGLTNEPLDVENLTWSNLKGLPYVNNYNNSNLVYYFKSHQIIELDKQAITTTLTGGNRVIIVDVPHSSPEFSVPGIMNVVGKGGIVEVEDLMCAGQSKTTGPCNHWLETTFQWGDVWILPRPRAHFGPVTIWELILVDQYSPVVYSFSESVNATNHFGPIVDDRVQRAIVGVVTNAPGNSQELKIEMESWGKCISIAWSFMPTGLTNKLIGSIGSHVDNIIVDKDCINHLAIECSGLPRNQETRNKLHSKARNYLKKTSCRYLRAIPHMVELALMLNVQTEFGAIIATERNHSELIKGHSDLLDGKLTGADPFLETIKWVSVGCLLMFLNNRKYQIMAQITKWVAKYSWKFITTGSVTMRARYLLPVLAAGLAWWFVQRKPQKKYPVVQDVCTENFKQLIVPEQDVAKAGVREWHEDCGPKQVATIFGVYSSTMLPVFPRACTHNSVNAIRSRLTFKNEQNTDDDLSQAVDELVDWMNKNPTMVFDGSYQTIKTHFIPESPKFWMYYRVPVQLPRLTDEVEVCTFEHWLAQHRWPEGKKQGLRAAVDEPLNDANKKVDNFVKFEAYAKHGPNGLIPFKPRPISSRSPAWQSKLGPISYTIGDLLSQKWNGNLQQNGLQIIYCSGLTGQDLGQLVYEAIERAGDCCEIHETDASTFDGSMTIQLLSVPLCAYYMLGLSKRDIKLMALEVETSGRCRGGTKYWFAGRRNSGDGDTSAGNSIVNGLCHKYLISQNPHVNYELSTMFVLGDDNLMILSVKPQFSRDEFKRNLSQGLTRYGMFPKLQCREQFEFCSGLFYPVTVDGKPTVVWGPKIGRILYKTGCVKRNMRFESMAQEMVGTFKGLENTIGHIPILSQYMANIFRTYGKKGRTITNPYNFYTTIAITQTQETRNFVMDRYGISPAELLSLETEVATADLPHALSHKFDEILFKDNDFDLDKQAVNNCEPVINWREVSNWSRYLGPLFKFGSAAFVTPLGSGEQELMTAVYVCLVAPIIEEYWRENHPKLWHAIGLQEALQGKILNPLIHTIITFGTGSKMLDIKYRIVIHLLWNNAMYQVITRQTNAPPRWNASEILGGMFLVGCSMMYNEQQVGALNSMLSIVHAAFTWPSMVVNKIQDWWSRRRNGTARVD